MAVETTQIKAAAGTLYVENHDTLLQDTKTFSKLLHDLTEKETKRPYGTEPIPSEVLASNIAGLAFLTTWKAGLGVGVTRGRGFLIRRLSKDGGHVGAGATKGWSAPVFIHLEALSAGFTVGFSSIQSVLVLEKDEALRKVAEGHHEAAIDTDLNMDVPFLIQFHSNQGDNTDYRRGTALPFSLEYSMANGVMADISFKAGYYKVDEFLNRSFYGNNITVDAILEGKLEPPEEVLPLYEELAKHVKA
jgi:lipid-binding SYLF domain-containing protein